MASKDREGSLRELITYIEKNLNKKYTIDEIKVALLGQGYSRTAVENALKVVEMSRPKPKAQIIIPKEEPKIIAEPAKKKGFFAKLFGL